MAHIIPAGGSGGASTLSRIAQVVLAAPAANIDFSSIPATFENLFISFTAASDQAAAQFLTLRFNGDSTSIYDYEYVTGSGSVASGTASVGQAQIFVSGLPGTNSAAGSAAGGRVALPSYARTTLRKTLTSVAGYIAGADGTSLSTFTSAGVYRSTAAINRITLIPGAGNLIAGSVATLYGEN